METPYRKRSRTPHNPPLRTNNSVRCCNFASSSVVERWGTPAKAGFLSVPDALITHQAQLRLSPVELLVLLNLCVHWWYHDRMPFPRTTTIAKRIGTHRRTVQRTLKTLKDRGLVQKVEL